MLISRKTTRYPFFSFFLFFFLGAEVIKKKGTSWSFNSQIQNACNFFTNELRTFVFQLNFMNFNVEKKIKILNTEIKYIWGGNKGLVQISGFDRRMNSIWTTFDKKFVKLTNLAFSLINHGITWFWVDFTKYFSVRENFSFFHTV